MISVTWIFLFLAFWSCVLFIYLFTSWFIFFLVRFGQCMLAKTKNKLWSNHKKLNKVFININRHVPKYSLFFHHHHHRFFIIIRNVYYPKKKQKTIHNSMWFVLVFIDYFHLNHVFVCLLSHLDNVNCKIKQKTFYSKKINESNCWIDW